MIWLSIALGGSVGALARFGLAGWVQERAGFAFPWGTLVVNVLGSLLIGISMRYMEAARVAPEVRALLLVGLLGAFTTFSTFSWETVALLENGAWVRAALYAGGSLVLGIIAVYGGMVVAGLIVHARG
jgi:CrcB protein